MSSTRGLKINLTQRCEDCEEHQQFLLDSGDGSQVVCKHPILEKSTIAAATATTPSTSSDHSDTLVIDVDDDVQSVGESVNATDLEEVPLTTSSSGHFIKSRKRKFPSFRQFAEAGGNELKRKVLPMVKWVSLTVREPYLVTKVVEIEVMMKKKKQPGFYAEIEDREGELKNTWITPMIYNALKNYPLEEGETFITPLGLKERKETGHMYNNFAVQIIKEN